MKLSQAAEVGRSMLLSLPTEVASLFLRAYKDDLKKGGGRFNQLVKILQNETIDKIDSSNDQHHSFKVWLRKRSGASELQDVNYVSRLLTTASNTTWFWSDIEVEGNDFHNPLRRIYFRLGVLCRSVDALCDAILNRSTSVVSYHVEWQTPHLAGLSSLQRDDYLCDFRYCEKERNYQLIEVKYFDFNDEDPQCFSVSDLVLLKLYLDEYSCIKSQRVSEGDGFLTFIKQLSVSKERSDEKYARWSRTLLKLYNSRLANS